MEFTFDRKKLDSLAKHYNLKFVILHGSYATGAPRSDSDLDIAIFGKKEVNFSDLLKFYGDCEKIFGNNRDRELDLKTLHGVDPLFRYEVVKTGKLLYGDPLEYEDYKAYAFRAYEDAKPLFELECLLVQKYQFHLKNFLHAQ